MNNRITGRATDFSYIALLVLIFAATVFISANTSNVARDTIILGLSLIPFLFAYFSTLTAALVVCSVVVLIMTATTVMVAFINGTRIPVTTYFFIAWIPLMTLCVNSFTKQLRNMQDKNRSLSDEFDRLSTIEPYTGLKNLRAFENDAKVYMNISNRYGMDLVMVVWQLRYQEELSQIVRIPLAIKRVSAAIRATLRKEDSLYVVDENPYRLGLMLLTKIDSLDIVLYRVKTAVAQIDFSDVPGAAGLIVELDSGIYQYNGDEITSLALLNFANIDLLFQTER